MSLFKRKPKADVWRLEIRDESVVTVDYSSPTPVKGYLHLNGDLFNVVLGVSREDVIAKAEQSKLRHKQMSAARSNAEVIEL